MMIDSNLTWEGVAQVKYELQGACLLRVSLPCRINIASIHGRAEILSGPIDRAILIIMAATNAQLKTEGWEWHT
jgi:hypothetical protein